MLYCLQGESILGKGNSHFKKCNLNIRSVIILFHTLVCQESSYLFSSKEPIGQELGNSFTPSIRIKEEPLDDEYDKAMAPPQGLLDKIKDEPDNSEVSVPFCFILWFLSQKLDTD